jgi:hypothetical protein
MRPVFCFEIMTAPQFLDMARRVHIVPRNSRFRHHCWLPGSGAAREDWESFMKPTRKLSRRSFLGRVAGGAIAGGAALTILGGEAQALQVSDSDSGPNADRSGQGRGNPNCSDNDSGQYGDPGGRGRRCGRPQQGGCSDNDSGANADRAGAGRRCGRPAGCTDRDTGRYADGVGRGRRCGGGGRSGITDGDSGNNADPGGNGRGPRRGRASGVTDGDSGRYADRANFGRGPRHR